jgi:hypothetical protein
MVGEKTIELVGETKNRGLEKIRNLGLGYQTDTFGYLRMPENREFFGLGLVHPSPGQPTFLSLAHS